MAVGEGDSDWEGVGDSLLVTIGEGGCDATVGAVSAARDGHQDYHRGSEPAGLAFSLHAEPRDASLYESDNS